jgi:hypothetical protein
MEDSRELRHGEIWTRGHPIYRNDRILERFLDREDFHNPWFNSPVSRFLWLYPNLYYVGVIAQGPPFICTQSRVTLLLLRDRKYLLQIFWTIVTVFSFKQIFSSGKGSLFVVLLYLDKRASKCSAAGR